MFHIGSLAVGVQGDRSVLERMGGGGGEQFS